MTGAPDAIERPGGPWVPLMEGRGGPGAVARDVALHFDAPIGSSAVSDGSPIDGILRAKVWARRARGTSCVDVHVEPFGSSRATRFRVFSGTPAFAAALSMSLGTAVSARFALSASGRARCVSLVPYEDGVDGQPEDVPGASRRARRPRAVCPVCGSAFEKRRSDMVYCRPGCRRRAAYLRRKEGGPNGPRV